MQKEMQVIALQRTFVAPTLRGPNQVSGGKLEASMLLSLRVRPTMFVDQHQALPTPAIDKPTHHYCNAFHQGAFQLLQCRAAHSLYPGQLRALRHRQIDRLEIAEKEALRLHRG